MEKYNLKLPPYPGTSLCVRIGKPPPKIDISALRENYFSPEFLEEQVEADPIDQVHTYLLQNAKILLYVEIIADVMHAIFSLVFLSCFHPVKLPKKGEQYIWPNHVSL